MRFVEEYNHTFKAHAKARWVGKSILSVYSKEFIDKSPEYYKSAILSGSIRVNSRLISPDYKISPNDVISHEIVVKEPSVIGDAIEIQFQNNELVVVNKPPNLPVHPSGRYRYNTLISILQYEVGLKETYLIHRLDRLTSGLMIIGLTRDKARNLCSLIKDGSFEKEYLALVPGQFPEHIECTEPILTKSHKLTLNIVHSEGKPSKTKFIRLFGSKEQSLVLCKPFTGRTHQIRVHLQYLGFPIVGDPIYGDIDIWGRNLGKGSISSEEIEKIIQRLEKLNGRPDRNDGSVKTSQSLHLHAFRYKIDGMQFEASKPEWAINTSSNKKEKLCID